MALGAGKLANRSSQANSQTHSAAAVSVEEAARPGDVFTHGNSSEHIRQLVDHL